MSDKIGILESAMIIQQIWRKDNHNPDREKRAETVGVLMDYAQQKEREHLIKFVQWIIKDQETPTNPDIWISADTVDEYLKSKL